MKNHSSTKLYPWREAGYDARRINPISSMMSGDESLYLHWLAREYYQGIGEIVDGGCLLGGSTFSLASGLVANPRVSQTEKRINSYDLWYYSSGFKDSILPDSNLQDGDSLLPLFLENTKLYESNIEPYPGNVCQRHWNGKPIEIFFVDFSKSWAINNHIIKEFFSSLIPGKSIVIQQNYYHYYTYWIHLTMQFFSDKYFQLVHRTNGGSVGFLLTEKIPKELLEIDYSTYFTTQQAIQLMDDAINAEQGLRQLWLIASKIRMLADRDEYDLAYPLLNEIRQSPYWHDTILYDLVHAANYLPFNMVFPGVLERNKIIGCSRRYCIIDDRQRVYAIPLLLSESLDLSDRQVLSQAIAVNTRNLPQISDIFNEKFMPLPPALPPKPPILIGTHREYNLVRYMNNIYAIPLKLGHINLELETDRNKPGILVTNSYDSAKAKVDRNLAITDHEKELFVNENKILFSLLIPTRNRPEKLKRLFSSIYHNTNDISNLEIVLGIDEDDEISQKIEDKRLNIKKTIIPPGQTMGSMNRACYDVCSGQYIMLLNDDVVLRSKDWDLVVKECFDNYKQDDIVLIHVNDLIYQEKLCTFPFVSRKFCELAGGNICPAEYIRYRIDDHIYNIFNMLSYQGYHRTVYLPNVIFEHDNYVEKHQQREYVYNEKIMEKDIEFDDLLLPERKECAIRLIEHIESQKVKHKMGRYRNNLLALDSSLRQLELRKVYGDSTPLSSKSARVTIGVVCPDIRNANTQKCIESIKENTTNYELIVVDNNWDKKFNHPREMNRIIENVKTEYLVLMDDDVFVEPGWLDGLLKSLKDHVGVVTPLHKNSEGKLSYAGVFLCADGTGDHAHIIEKSEQPRPIPTLCSAILLIDMNKCGHLRMNERNKKYFLDLDYGLKVWESGYEVVCTSEVIVTHVGGGTLGFQSAEGKKIREPDRLVFVKDWIDTKRLERIQKGIWQNYPYLKYITELCVTAEDIYNELEQNYLDPLSERVQNILTATQSLPLLRQKLLSRLPEPKLIEDWGTHNVVFWLGSYYSLPKSLGKIDLQTDDITNLEGIFVSESLNELKSLVANGGKTHSSSGEKPRSQTIESDLAKLQTTEVSAKLLIEIGYKIISRNSEAHSDRARWFTQVIDLYCKGIVVFPDSLILHFKLIQTALYFGGTTEVLAALELAREVLNKPRSYWQIDIIENIFSEDVCLTSFDLDKYNSLVRENLLYGKTVTTEIVNLILASIHYFWGHYKFEYAQFLIEDEGLEDNSRHWLKSLNGNTENSILETNFMPATPQVKLLSIVVTGRNDDYMGNFKYRLTTCLNFLCRNLAQLGRLDDVEILITDWNSDVPLANVLTLSPEASRICKFVCVPPERATRLQAPGEVFYPTCAMNASLRRAKGEFVMMFDADSLMPYHSLQALLNVLEGKQPVGLKLDQTFFYCSRHHLPLEVVQREPSLEELDRYLLLNGPGFSKDEGWPGLGVCGAAQMMHSSLWQECRGYNQDFQIQGWLDAELTLRVTQHYAWVDLLSLGVVLFHMEHWADNRQGKENVQKHNPHDVSSSLAVNDENWGLGNYELEIKTSTLRMAAL